MLFMAGAALIGLATVIILRKAASKDEVCENDVYGEIIGLKGKIQQQAVTTRCSC